MLVGSENYSSKKLPHFRETWRCGNSYILKIQFPSSDQKLGFYLC